MRYEPESPPPPRSARPLIARQPAKPSQPAVSSVSSVVKKKGGATSPLAAHVARIPLATFALLRPGEDPETVRARFLDWLAAAKPTSDDWRVAWHQFTAATPVQTPEHASEMSIRVNPCSSVAKKKKPAKTELARPDETLAAALNRLDGPGKGDTWQNGVKPGPRKLAQFQRALRLRGTPPLRAQDGAGDAAVAHVKLFDPAGSWTGYLTEWDGATEAFGWVQGHEAEWGYVDLQELATTPGRMGIGIEVDTHWRPTAIENLREAEPGPEPDAAESVLPIGAPVLKPSVEEIPIRVHPCSSAPLVVAFTDTAYPVALRWLQRAAARSTPETAVIPFPTP